MQSLERLVGVLDALADAGRAMSVQELAQSSGLDRAVVHRMVKALVETELVERDRVGRYRMGTRALLYASTYVDHLAVRRVGLPYAVDLRDRLGRELPAVVGINIRVRTEMTVVDAVWGDKIALDSILQVGSRFPVDRSATGRCVLAFLPRETCRALLGDRLTPQLETRLARIRAAGGIDSTLGDSRAGIIGLGATIFGAGREPIAALAVYGSGPKVAPLADVQSEEAVAVRRAADAIGFAIAGPLPVDSPP